MSTDPERKNLRASDADRESVAGLLHQASGEGRISFGELEDRLTKVYAAQTYGELEPLIADLPMGLPSLGRKEPDTIRLTATVNDVRREGRWKVPRHIIAKTEMGNIHLDFTEAVLPVGEVLVEVESKSGGVVVVVPDGVPVNAEGIGVDSGSVSNAVTDETLGLSRIRVIGHSGMGDVVIRRPRRRWKLFGRR
ncbi:DUF1707 SHOCT-like domain-containing protein [Hoyosella subflava]|uniref:DUF1707 domain-containing protein n=1 Tax=Hoyosella subflava (strain DSM 45089 / JCM 17490 / NBRC 109087 / DQS3-9A1) TaxID=443218 RepID=F6EH82_HOYSD|nr:DUF1707 domain-containing protein [Hoyosella subflava]AEF39919.1 hypothetical protein AS9A_1467 [Hoyosella subflava DQS3-9A1]